MNSKELGVMAKKGFTNWKKATGTFNSHASLKYHTDCAADDERFKQTWARPGLSIENRINQGRQQQILKNRRRLVPIIEEVLLCGRQELALRGHCNISISEETQKNEGNFRAVLRYTAKVDVDLQDTLEGPGYKYLSPKIQNSILEGCNDILLKNVVDNVNKAKCFAVLLDETSDISGVEQVSIYVPDILLRKQKRFAKFF